MLILPVVPGLGARATLHSLPQQFTLCPSRIAGKLQSHAVGMRPGRWGAGEDGGGPPSLEQELPAARVGAHLQPRGRWRGGSQWVVPTSAPPCWVPGRGAALVHKASAELVSFTTERHPSWSHFPATPCSPKATTSRNSPLRRPHRNKGRTELVNPEMADSVRVLSGEET